MTSLGNCSRALNNTISSRKPNIISCWQSATTINMFRLPRCVKVTGTSQLAFWFAHGIFHFFSWAHCATRMCQGDAFDISKQTPSNVMDSSGYMLAMKNWMLIYIVSKLPSSLYSKLIFVFTWIRFDYFFFLLPPISQKSVDATPSLLKNILLPL